MEGGGGLIDTAPQICIRKSMCSFLQLEIMEIDLGLGIQLINDLLHSIHPFVHLLSTRCHQEKCPGGRDDCEAVLSLTLVLSIDDITIFQTDAAFRNLR